MSAPLPVLINAVMTSHHGADLLARLHASFAANGVEARVIAVDRHNLTQAAGAAVAARPPLIVAGGGDGTLGAVASVLVGTDTALGVLPLGTFNHFAKDLGIPMGLDDAVRIVVARHRDRVDVGEVNGRIFLNNASLGIYPQMVAERQRRQRLHGSGKFLAAAMAMIATLWRFPFLSVRVRIHGEQHLRHSAFVFIGNNEYRMDGHDVGGRRGMQGGILSLVVSRDTGRWGMVVLAARALLGTLREADDLDVGSARELSIETRHRRMRVATDGELVVVDTPLRFRIRAAALWVITPESET
jgi:diacylglycerol kinase family enzyme